MNKKLLVSMLIITFAVSESVNFNCAEQKVVLASRFLQIVDGVFINGEIAGITLQIRKKLIEMMEGKRQPDGTHEGFYIFENIQYCIHTLAELETTLLELQKTLENKLRAAQTDQEKRDKNCELEVVEKQIKKLNEILEVAKQDFQDIVFAFLSNARAAKEPVLMLIMEYCEKANRQDSLLLDWAKMEGEEETKSFNKQVINFNIFYTFAGDLANFLEALIRGCPKAQQQFKKLMLEKSKKTT